jgi:lipopolysaccharide cholinephosphotransferase
VPRFKLKEQPLYIDLFIFDFTSNSAKGQQWHVLKLKFMQGILKRSLMLSKGNFIAKILSLTTYLVGIPFSKESKLKLHDKISTAYNTKKSSYLLSTQDQYKYIHNVLPSSIIESYKKVDFEDTQLMIMNGYHKYLTIFHGNYMQLPPENLRIPAHGNV